MFMQRRQYIDCRQKSELDNVASDDTYFIGAVSQSLLLESFLFLWSWQIIEFLSHKIIIKSLILIVYRSDFPDKMLIAFINASRVARAKTFENCVTLSKDDPKPWKHLDIQNIQINPLDHIYTTRARYVKRWRDVGPYTDKERPVYYRADVTTWV